MKEIKDWEAVIKNEEGVEKIALPLPGCVIKGHVEGNGIEVQTEDVDISNLTVRDSAQEEYLLSGANREYLSKIDRCIEVGENERDGEER